MSLSKPKIVGKSKIIKEIIRLTKQVGDYDLNVLITGESGVGKELVARALHYYSFRAKEPFIKINCAAIPAELLESELFGYEKGAFTGATSSRIGKFELARSGTIFLDEIGEISISLQAKLLQVLQDRCFFRVGGHREIKTTARVVAATNRNLEAEITAGSFREDLFYRLSTICIHIPPLRERKEDILPLVEYFIKEMKKQYPHKNLSIPPDLAEVFLKYHWPGNVRELYNYIQRLFVLGDIKAVKDELLDKIKETDFVAPNVNDSIDEIDASLTNRIKNKDIPSLKEIKDSITKKVERMVILKILNETNWNRKETAKLLKISYRALLYKMKDMKITPPPGIR